MATDAELRAAAAAAGFTGNDLNVAVAVAKAESGGRADARNDGLNRNGSVDFGAWQINSIHTKELASGNWQDVNANARMAYSIFKSSGWKAWSTVNSGSYLKYLTAPGATPANTARPTVDAAGNPIAGAVGSASAAASTATGFAALPGAVEMIAALLTFLVGDPTRPGSKGLSFLLLPTTWVRIGAGIGGAVLLLLGVLALLREVKK